MFKKLAALAILLLFSGACATTSPNVPMSPLASATYWNDILANSNNSLATTIISLNTNRFISVASAGAILRINYNIAEDQGVITNILQNTTQLTSTDVAQITTYLTNLKAQCDTLIADGSAGISDPKSKTKFLVVVNVVISVAQSFLNSLS